MIRHSFTSNTNPLFAPLNRSISTENKYYSSRMHTTHLLLVSPSMHCAEGEGCLLLGGVFLWPWRGLLLGGVCSWGGVCLPLVPGMGVTQHSGRSRISPRRGQQLPRGVPTYDFPKTAWNWKNLDPQGGARPNFYYVDPPLQHVMEQTPPVNRILDTHFWKYYLTQTSLRAANMWI